MTENESEIMKKVTMKLLRKLAINDIKTDAVMMENIT